ncbi:MAG: serpin family protein [Acidimicrobiales bacterium]|jgi:serpin B
MSDQREDSGTEGVAQDGAALRRDAEALRRDAEAVRRYAASLPDLEWQAPAEIRRRGTRRRRLRRVAAGSVVSVSVTVCITLSLTLSGSSPKAPPNGQAIGTTTFPSHGVTAVASKATYVPSSGAPAPAAALAEQKFALDLTKHLLATAGDSNVVVSPASLDEALNTLELGATGATKAGIAATLGEGLPPGGGANIGWKSLEQQLQATTSGPLQLSSHVFVAKGSHISASYLANLKRDFGAGVEEVDFRAGRAAPDINAWLHAQPSPQVAFTPADTSPSTKLLVTAESSFSAKWGPGVLFSVPSLSPAEETFHVTPASAVAAVMMQLDTSSVPFVSTSEQQAVVLPYSGGRYEAVVLQAGAGSAASLLSALTPAGLSAILASAHTGALEVFLPAFSVSASADLRPALEALGMGTAFSSGANFTDLTGVPGARLQDVLQAGSLNVGKAGTNVTQLSSSGLTTSHGQPTTISFDHPFLFLVRDIATGAIVSDAVINNPNQAGS